jgi:hypothetical protein
VDVPETEPPPVTGQPPVAEPPPAGQPPVAEPDDNPGLVGDLVGALSEAAMPVTSYLFSTVDSATGGLLGG